VALWLKNLLFTVVVPGSVGVYLPLWIARGRAPAAGPRLAASLLLLLAAGALYAWCAWDFARFGRGTPAPIDAPRRLVIRGPYRHVRNPMYVAVLAAILGFALCFGSGAVLLYGALVLALFHAFVVLYEEPDLGRRFGPEYRDYRARVARWWPALRPRAAGSGTARPSATSAQASPPGQSPKRP
jgi:protein-S-isoprenylcysteine O-methyltransferase Ste14